MPSFPPLTALLYHDSQAADRMLRLLAVELIERGVRLAGLVQLNEPRPGRSRCDMTLEDLASGDQVGISQDRGPHARGCALDIGQLLSATEMVRASLADAPDLVILNKFGKTESEGGGFRDLIAEAVGLGLPLLIAVPWRNLESWRLFSGGEGVEREIEALPREPRALLRLLGLDDVRDRAIAAEAPLA